MKYRTLRKLAPFGLLAIVPLAAPLPSLLAPDPSGHWIGHLASASASAGQLLALLIGAVIIRRRLNLPLLLPIVILATGLVIQVVANLQIAESIWRTPYGDDVWQYGGEAFEAGHVLASLGDNVVVIAGLAFVIMLTLFRRVGILAALFGILLSFSPPWMLPAVGSILLVAIIAYRQQNNSSESRAISNAKPKSKAAIRR